MISGRDVANGCGVRVLYGGLEVADSFRTRDVVRLTGQIECRKRQGGLLRYCHRTAKHECQRNPRPSGYAAFSIWGVESWAFLDLWT